MKKISVVKSFFISNKKLLLRYIFALVCCIGASLVSLISPLLMANVIDKGIGNKDADTLILNLIVLLAISILGSLLSYFINYQFGYLRKQFVIYVKLNIISKLAEFDEAEWSTFSPGMVLNFLENDVEQVSLILTDKVYTIFYDILTFLGAAFVMIVFDYKVFLVSFILAGILMLMNRFFGRKLYKLRQNLHKAADEQIVKEQEFINNLLYNIQVNNFNYHKKRIKQSEYTKQDCAYKVNLIETANIESSSILHTVASVMVWFIGGMSVLTGTMTLGSLTALASYSSKIWSPLLSLTNTNLVLKQFKIALERINTVALYEHSDKAIPQKQKKQGLVAKEPIVFENIAFEYNENRQIINDLTMTLWPGQYNAIVGESGEGKTTIVKLLTKICTPDNGEIFIGANNIKKIDTTSIRESIAYVPQSPIIFRDSLRNNLCLNRDIEDGELRAKLAQVGLSELLANLENGLDTLLESDGKNLSGGEKQRIAIARALCSNSPIIILDEPTSNLDGISKAVVEEVIFSKLLNHTVVIITHDGELAKKAVHINILQGGNIIASGSHAELSETSEQYNKLFSRCKGE